MTEITREMLYNNLTRYEQQVTKKQNQTWQRVMQLLDKATMEGKRSITVDPENLFTLDEMTYIKLRVVKEGWKWHTDSFSGHKSQDTIVITI